MKTDERTIGQRLQALEKKHGMNHIEFAAAIGFDLRDYRNKYRDSDKEPSAWAGVALTMLEEHGVKKIQKLTKRLGS